MAFTAQEKTEASRFVLGMMELSKGMVELANVLGEHAHDRRKELLVPFGHARAIWQHGRIWFGNLADVHARAGVTRDMFLKISKDSHANVVRYADGLVTSTAVAPDLAQANVHFKAMRDIFAPFDWSLAYEQPRHDNNPNTPFDDAKTLVGPHGDWAQAVISINFVMWYVGETWMSFQDLFTKPAIYPQEANEPLKVLTLDFAHLVDRVSRVFSMHIEVESPEDTAIIDADHAAASGARSRAFHRALLQTELLFNQRASVGNNWHGRTFEIGAVHSLNFQHLQDWFDVLAKANGEQFSWDMVVMDAGSGGPQAGFIGRMTDFWQVLDAWAIAAFGFFHNMPNPTIFVPIETGPPNGKTTIPLGFFNPQAAQVAEAKAEMANVRSDLDALESGLRLLEGKEI